MKRFINELRRRNVFRVAPTYAVVAWVMGQGAGLILPTFEAPDWVLKAFISLLLLGFPVVIILTWAYELTPEGLRRTPAEGEEAEGGGKTRLLDSVMIVALVIAVASVTALNAGLSDGSARKASTETAPETPSRMAVMPLVGVNTDSGTELLAHGLTSELIFALRRAPGLSLAGAESSFSYLGDKATLESVGEQLQVGHVVQGSVRRNDGRISVNIQLISVPEGKELWSEDYQRSREDLRPVLNDMVAGIRRALGANGDYDAGEGAPPARYGALYEDWLTLLGHLQNGSRRNLLEARVIAQRLTARAPEVGHGFAARALIELSVKESTSGGDQGDAADRPGALLDQALTLSPRSERVLQWRAEVESRMARARGRVEDYQRIFEDFRRALELFPRRPALLTAFARHCAAFGEHARAVDLSRRALEVDPRSESAHAIQVESLMALGRFDAASDAAAKMADTLPESQSATRLSARVLAARGELEKALVTYAEIKDPAPATLRDLARIHASRDDVSAALNALGQWPDEAADILQRDIWRKALKEDPAAAYALAEKELAPLRTGEAALLGRLSVQIGNYAEAVEHFSAYFSDWLGDSGPLLGETAWMNAPWYAFALLEAGRSDDARRLLDRHLAGLVQMEGRLAASKRDLYLAANYAVQSRDGDAVAALERAVGQGLRVTWSALGAPIALEESAILRRLPEEPGFSRLLSKLDQRNAPGNGSRAD